MVIKMASLVFFFWISLSSFIFFAFAFFIHIPSSWTVYSYLHRLCFLWLMFAAVLFSKDTTDRHCFCIGWLGRFAAKDWLFPILWGFLVSTLFPSPFILLMQICMGVHVLSHTFCGTVSFNTFPSVSLEIFRFMSNVMCAVVYHLSLH
jgi:hypothetical protein